MGIKFKEFLLDQADSIVKQIDTSLINMAVSEGKIFKTEKDYRNLVRWTTGTARVTIWQTLLCATAIKNK